MKIVFGVAGEGFGHSTRIKPVIEHFKKDKIQILTGGKSFDYLSKYYTIHKISSPRLFYINNEVSTVFSAFLNLSKLPFFVYSLMKTTVIFLKFQPDVVINDFELFTNWVAILFRVPVIHLDNGRIITECSIETPKKPYLSYLKVVFFGRLINPTKSFGLLPSFFTVPCKKDNKIVFPPLRCEIKELATKDKGFCLVYQTSASYKILLSELKKVNLKFIVYGFDKEVNDGNLVFKKFGKSEFFEDLASCCFVITNGGFSLISESLYLKKPVLSCPVKKQFEQEINSFYLDKIGYGRKVSLVNAEVVNTFASQLEKYRKNLKLLKWKDNFFIELDKAMKRLI